MNQKLFLTLALLMTVCSFGMAQSKQAYAVYTVGDEATSYLNTLTFYYDDQKSTRPGTKYDLNTGNSAPGWYADHKSDIQRVDFDESFKDARPTSTYRWFSCFNLTELVRLSYLNTSEVTNMSYMFSGCKLSSIDLRYFDTSKVTNMEYMFSSCSKLINVNVSSFNTSNVTNMTRMFNWCTELAYINLASFDTKKIEDLGFVDMFFYCSKLKTIYVSSDWRDIGCSMFQECNQLVGGEGTHYEDYKWSTEFARVDGGDSKPGYFTQIPSGYAVFEGDSLTFYNDGKMSMKEGEKYLLNVAVDMPVWCREKGIEKVVFDKSFATARPISTYNWFGGLNILAEIKGWQYLNTSEVTTMNGMFCGCSRITNLDLSHFNTSKVTDMAAMFISCISLKEINLLSFDTSNVTTMGLMFSGCNSLETINLGSFNTKKVTEMQLMFSSCGKLKTICVGDNWSVDNVVDGCRAMFAGCGNLVGEKGTECDGLWRNDKQFAHIDGGEDDPGYLSSLKSYNLWIDGVQVTSVNNNNIGGGSFSYDPSANKLTINKSFSSSSSNDIINNAIPELSIYIPMDVSLSSSKEVSIIKTSQPLFITGPGYLTCTCPELGCGIDVSEGSTLRITNANLVIQCGYGLSGYFNNSTDESLVVANSNVQINSSECAIGLFKGGISLEGCNITTPENWVVDDNGSIRTDYSYAKEIVITRDSNISTDIDDSLRDSVKGQRDGWYTIDGRKLNGMPAKKGIYIHNGKKAVLKN